MIEAAKERGGTFIACINSAVSPCESVHTRRCLAILAGGLIRGRGGKADELVVSSYRPPGSLGQAQVAIEGSDAFFWGIHPPATVLSQESIANGSMGFSTKRPQ